MELLARLSAPPREAKVVGLICTGHFFSHFFTLLVPPLFPLLKEFYGVGFVELGFATACFSVASGFTQIPVGFMVDRYGARQILIWGLLVESLAIMMIGVFPFYGALVALMIAAGLCNSVFHPADYAILNTMVDRKRIGRVFSLHTFTGYLGDAVAPATILFLAFLFDWRVAIFMCGLLGFFTGVVLWINAGLLVDHAGTKKADRGGNKPDGTPGKTGMALLLSLPVIMGLLFFAVMTMSASGIRTFGISALHEAYGASLGAAGVAISAYLFASPVGVLAGGWVADRIVRHDVVAAVCILIIAACVFPVAAFDPPLWAIGVLFAVAGFAWGFLAPPRDMIIRSLAPPSEIGKVFGFVSAGFALSGIVAPIVYGWILDHSDARNVFWVAGFVGLLTIATVLGTGRASRRA
jgi:FSR family fosmidomycin resistance protein-like MFS transporter